MNLRGARRPARASAPARAPVSAKVAAIRMLARREYGRAELTQRLLARGIVRDEIERSLDELEQLGYLSDTRYAQGVVAQKAGRFAKRAIVHALKEKGVATPAAAEALAALEGGDELADATALWRRRFGAAPANDKEKARQVRFLLARGYSPSIAFKVLRAAGAAVDDAKD
jgi:regulatory protein